MSNTTLGPKVKQQAEIITRLGNQNETLMQIQMRQLLVIACYEAQYGGIPGQLLERVNTVMHGKTFRDHESMYKAAMEAANMVKAELEYEAAAEIARADNSSNLDSVSSGVLPIPLSEPDTLGNPED